MRALALPASSYSRAATARSMLLGTVFIAVAAGISILLRDQPTPSLAFAIMSDGWSGLLALFIIRQPQLGLYVTIFATVLFEAFPVPFDPTSSFTWIFHANLSTWTPVPLPLSPVEFLLIVTTMSWVIHAGNRRAFSLPLGTLGGPIIAFAVCILIGLVYGIGANSGDVRIALWESRALFYLFISYFLTGAIIRQQKQAKTIVVLIALGLALNALRLIWRFLSTSAVIVGDQGVSGLSHENALFIAFMIVFAIAIATFGRTGRLRLVALVSLPFFVLALLASQRRVAFVTLFLGLIVWAVLLGLQRRSLFIKIVPLLILVFSLYIGAFWNNTSGLLGQPIRSIHTVLGTGPISERDISSDLYRETEETNIWLTIRESPLTGVGFGKPFIEFIPLVRFEYWEFQFYTPHNQVFWLWLKMGPLGFVITFWLFSLAIAQTARLARETQGTWLQPFMVASLAYVIMLLVFAYVDVGLANGRSMLVLGILLGVIGYLPRMSVSQTGTETIA